MFYVIDKTLRAKLQRDIDPPISVHGLAHHPKLLCGVGLLLLPGSPTPRYELWSNHSERHPQGFSLVLVLNLYDDRRKGGLAADCFFFPLHLYGLFVILDGTFQVVPEQGVYYAMMGRRLVLTANCT